MPKNTASCSNNLRRAKARSSFSSKPNTAPRNWPINSTRPGISADAIHGDLQQRRRDRVIQGFRDKKFRILVATDVAARGLDIPHIEHVINYDLPQCPEDYIHRIGRTARAGAEGEAVNLLTSADGAKWKAIHRLMNGEDPNTPAPRRAGPSRNAARKPFWKKEGGDRPRSDRPFAERATGDRPRSDRHAPKDARRPSAHGTGTERPPSKRPPLRRQAPQR